MPLPSAERELFADLRTRNFETVLFSLRVAAIVADALGEPRSRYDAAYEAIRRSLQAAVVDVHVQWERFTDEQLRAAQALEGFPPRAVCAHHVDWAAPSARSSSNQVRTCALYSATTLKLLSEDQ